MNVAPMQMIDVANFATQQAGNAGTPAPAHFDDVTKFQQNFADAAPAQVANAEAVAPVTHELSTGFKAVMSQFDSLNGKATQLGKLATAMRHSSKDMTPGQVVDMTMKCQELVFQAELTSNVANRGSDGVSQLFRQQS
jgi:hypothetical protein